MKKVITSATAIAMLSLTACGGGADDKAARNIEAAAENQAEMMDARADNMSNGQAADAMRDRAEQVEDQGERQAEAVDRNDGPTANTSGAATTTTTTTTTNRVQSNVSGM